MHHFLIFYYIYTFNLTTNFVCVYLIIILFKPSLSLSLVCFIPQLFVLTGLFAWLCVCTCVRVSASCFPVYACVCMYVCLELHHSLLRQTVIMSHIHTGQLRGMGEGRGGLYTGRPIAGEGTTMTSWGGRQLAYPGMRGRCPWPLGD